jgi:mRNA interferase RelE/StbE
MRIAVSLQVAGFLRRQAPEPRRTLRQALRDLAKGKGDIVALEGPLEGYCRLRVGGFRIIFAYAGRSSIQCVFAERRSIVYEVFAEALANKLAGFEE